MVAVFFFYCSGRAYLHSLHWLYVVKKALSAHIITFDFHFHQEHSKAHLHSCHIHTGDLFHLLSPYLYLLPPSHFLSILLSFFLFLCLSLSFFDLPFMSLD